MEVLSMRGWELFKILFSPSSFHYFSWTLPHLFSLYSHVSTLHVQCEKSMRWNWSHNPRTSLALKASLYSGCRRQHKFLITAGQMTNVVTMRTNGTRHWGFGALLLMLLFLTAVVVPSHASTLDLQQVSVNVRLVQVRLTANVGGSNTYFVHIHASTLGMGLPNSK